MQWRTLVHVRELREARGMSQRDAAQKRRVSHTALHSYEVGRTLDGNYVAIPKRELLTRIAELYQSRFGPCSRSWVSLPSL